MGGRWLEDGLVSHADGHGLRLSPVRSQAALKTHQGKLRDLRVNEVICE